MKVAFIGQKGIPALSGGVERHVEELALGLYSMGVDVTVYCRNTYSNDQCNIYKGIKRKIIKTVDNKNLDAIVYTLRATIDALKGGYDILHYHAIGPASLTFIPEILKRKVVVTVHGLDWKRDKWGGFAKSYLKFGERMTGNGAAKIISVSMDLKEYFTQKYQRAGDDVIFIPNGVHMIKPKKPEIINKYGLTENKYILFLARLVPEKGAHYLIEAYKKLKTHTKLVIAGGPSYTESYAESLKKLAGRDIRIIFTGQVEGDMLIELYSSCYLYVLPSDLEGMPITLLEAMSFGRCPLVSDIPENKYIIHDGKFGFSFTQGSVDDLAHKLDFLLNNPLKVKSIGDASLGYIEREFNWDKIAKSTLDVYKALM